MRTVHPYSLRERDPARYLFNAARGTAKSKGLPFSLSLADIEIPAVCPVLGIPLAFDSRAMGPNAPSIDRIDNARGYVRGNVIVISWRANQLKRDATVEELRRLHAFYSEIERDMRELESIQ